MASMPYKANVICNNYNENCVQPRVEQRNIKLSWYRSRKGSVGNNECLGRLFRNDTDGAMDPWMNSKGEESNIN